MPRETETAFESAVVSQLTRRLIPFLFLLYIVAYLDRINVGFAALQMRQQLHFSYEVYGLGAGMFFAGYFFFQLPSNLVLERVGARRWIALLMVVWGMVSGCMILVRTPREFYGVRFALGLAEAGFFPGVILYLKSWFPARARARTIASFVTASALSGVVGSPISAALLGLHNLGGLAGWQWLFLLEALPAIVLGIVVLFYLTDRPEEAHWLGEERRSWLLANLAEEKRTHPDAARSTKFSAFANVNIWLLTFVYFGLNTVSYGLSLWLPNVVRSLSGVSNFTIGLLVAIPYVAAAISMVLVGRNSDRTGQHRWHVAISAFAGAAALFVASQSSSVALSIVTMSIAVSAVNCMIGPLWAMPTTFLTGTAAAAGIAIINSLANLGGFFGPWIIGKLRDVTGSYEGGLLAVGATLGLAGGVTLLVRIRRPEMSGEHR